MSTNEIIRYRYKVFDGRANAELAVCLSVCLSAIVFSDVCTELIRGNRQEDNMTMMADTLCALLCSFKMKLIDLFTVQCISDINFVKLRDSLQ